MKTLATLLVLAALSVYGQSTSTPPATAPIATNGATGIATTDLTGHVPLNQLPQIPYTQILGAPPIPTVPTNVSAFSNDANYATPTTVQAAIKAYTPAVVASVLIVTSLPSTCTIGQIAFLTSATAGQNVFGCTAANVWTAQGTPVPGAPKLASSAPAVPVGTSVTITSDHPVLWALTPGSIGAISNVTPTSVTYTAPATAPQPQNMEAGCPVAPYDSVFNTRIDNLPVNPNSAAWTQVTTNMVSYGSDFAVNVVDNSLTATPMTFHYTTSYNGTPFQLPGSSGLREMGRLTTDYGVNDHHMITVNHQTCQFYETYQDAASGPNTAQSGYTYPGSNYAVPSGGTTDAAGLPLDPLVIHLSEIYSGAINHAVRFTLCTGCISSQGVLWPATGANGSNIPLTKAPPNGARFRLKSSYILTGLPIPQQIVLTALQRYGMFLADNGGSGQVQMDADVTQDYNVYLPISHISWSNIAFNKYFEAVDESSLMLNPHSYAVNAANALQKPSTFAQLTATDLWGNNTVIPLAVQPVTLGTQYQTITFLAGAPAYQLNAWANGTANQTINWTLTTGPGTLTAGGQYTPPATVAALTPVIFSGVSAADPTAQVAVHGNVIPLSQDGTIRIDSGNYTKAYTDKAGITWQPDFVAQENVNNNPVADNYPVNLWGSSTVVDPNLYQYAASSQGGDIVYGPFVAPNGNYKITYTSGIPNCGGTWTPSTWNSGLTWGPNGLESQGQIQDVVNISALLKNACRVPIAYSFPAVVANNTLELAWRGMSFANKHSVPFVTTLQIAADSTPPHVAINTSGVTAVPVGTTARFSAVGWYMTNTVTWSAVLGTIDQTGNYAAPATVTAPSTETITATSTVDPTATAAVQFTVQ